MPLLDRLVMHDLPGRPGLDAWTALLRAHATLVRQLDADLEKETGLALADFDVLAQPAVAGGELRMTDLADRALLSRSGMTRRVARLVEAGLVRRDTADGDARGAVVALTEAGIARLEVLADRAERWLVRRGDALTSGKQPSPDPGIVQLIATSTGSSSPAWDRLKEIARERAAFGRPSFPESGRHRVVNDAIRRL